MTFVSSLIVMALAPLISMPLLKLLNTPDEIINWCDDYLRILFLGIAGCAFYNILGGILRGLGDSVSALLYLIIATFLNIILDIFFVAYVGMGVPGVALATVIAQAISAFLSFLKLRRMTDSFDMKAAYLKPDRKYLRELLRLGLPSGVTQAIFSLSIVIVQSLTNSFGAMCIATNVIVMRIDGFVMMPAFSFGSAMTTFAGQNIGAGRLDRVENGAKKGTLVAMATSAVITLLILLFGRYLMALFTDTDALTVSAGRDERCRRYNGSDVALNDNHSRYPRSARISHDGHDKVRRESSRRVLHDVRIAADHMAHRRHTDNDRVQSRQVEAESAHLVFMYNI